MNIKMIVLDLDGTILKNDKTISELTLSSLSTCRKKGIKVTVATSRSEKAARRYLELIKPDFIISNNGALATSNGIKLYECMIPAKTADLMISDLFKMPELVWLSSETETGFYVDGWNEPDSPDYSHAIRHDFTLPLSEDTYKITASLTSIDKAKKLLTVYPICRLIYFSDSSCCRFSHINAKKIIAIEKIADFCGIKLSNIAAFGDDFIDADMLVGCGIGVAMGNAIPEIKNIAKYICGSNENDGVAHWLEQFVLK